MNGAKIFNTVCAALLTLAMLFIPATSLAKVVEEHIYIIPAGKVDKNVLVKLKDRIRGSMPMTVRVAVDPAQEIPQAAFDASRRQYGAQAILDDIAGRLRLMKNERALIVADVDMYAGDLNFVFGLADAGKQVAIISLTRLRNEFYGLKPDGRAFTDRVVKEAAHELGHSWNLPHCPNTRCVMYFSNSLQDTDRKRDVFCYKCQIALDHRHGGTTLLGRVMEKK